MKTLRTVRGYLLSEAVSAMQKAVRRGDARLAGYFAVEMFESNYTAYLWRRLLTISAEDVAGIITQEIESLYRSWVVIDASRKGAGRIFIAKAIVLLCQATKCRDADHLTNLVYDAKALDEQSIDAALDEARTHMEPIPDWALDCHTAMGRALGRTKRDFFIDEHDALTPRAPGLFDSEIEKLRRRLKN